VTTCRGTWRDEGVPPNAPGTILSTCHGDPALVGHEPSRRCPLAEPHSLEACGEFDPPRDPPGVARYVYLGDALTDPALVGQPCDPVRRADGRCIVSTKFATALVVFADGLERVVKRRRLRVVDRAGRRP
jgi:hypothetical protein